MGLLILSLTALGCADGGDGDSGDVNNDATGDATGPTDGGPDGSDTVDPGGNQAPELDKIGNRRAPIGKPLLIEVEASDPDGDALSYSVFGALPEGSKFSKDTRTFEWTPSAADDGALVILTFAVSDGEDEDRETIQITVTASDESTQPDLAPIGDQFVEPEVAYELRLQATDEDGDPLVYSTNNPLPNGAELDSKTGVMSWTPTTEQQGSSFRVSFVVSDGEFTDEEDARFLVQTAELALKKMAPRDVALGETLEVALPIVNPQDFKYDCELVGVPPAGASFDVGSCTLSYTPTDASLVDTSVEFVFRVTGEGNGVDYNLIESLTVSIRPGDGGVCEPDTYEPNDTEAAATMLEGRTSLSELTICGDEDWYAFDVPEGARVSAAIQFEHRPGGDLDLLLYGPTGEDPLVAGESTSSNESVVLPVASAGMYVLRVYEFSDDSNTYDLDLTVETGGVACEDDVGEPNDTMATATPLPATSPASTDGHICAGNVDWFAFDANTGQSAQVVLVFDNSEGDLDLELHTPSGTLLSASRLTVDEEFIEIPSLPESGTYGVRINGYEGAEASYLLEVTTAASTCPPDPSEPNDTPGAATMLSAGSQTLADRTWCEPDYYRLTLAAGESLEVTVTPDTAGSPPELYLLSANGAVTLSTGTPDGSGGSLLSFAGDSTQRDYLIEVSNGSVGSSYALDIAVNSAACDATSCDEFEVCGDAGTCVTDLCQSDSDCPSNYTCRQTYCVDACLADSDCRTDLGYACRVLDPSDPIAFCSPTGTGATGDPCLDLASCGAPLACLKGPRFPGGLCASIGCASDADCDVDSTCVDVDGAPICLPFCLGDSDCRDSDGYTCQALPSIGTAGTIEVCIN